MYTYAFAQILTPGLEQNFQHKKGFCCIPGSSGEPEEYSDEYIDLVSSKICHFHFR
jgi:hypothetical protein